MVLKKLLRKDKMLWIQQYTGYDKVLLERKSANVGLLGEQNCPQKLNLTKPLGTQIGKNDS